MSDSKGLSPEDLKAILADPSRVCYDEAEANRRAAKLNAEVAK